MAAKLEDLFPMTDLSSRIQEILITPQQIIQYNTIQYNTTDLWSDSFIATFQAKFVTRHPTIK